MVHERGEPPRPSKPKDEANRKDYYTFTDRGYPDDGVEKMLSKAESLVAPVIRKLGSSQFRMNDTQRSELYTFLTMTWVRVPAYRTFLDAQMAEIMTRVTREDAKDAEAFYGRLRQFEEESGKCLGDHENIREYLLSDAYTVRQASVGYNLRIALQSSFKINEVLEREYGYEIWYAPAEGFFMTCDNPLITLEPDRDGTAYLGMGVGYRNTEVLFPLNKRACLRLSRSARGEYTEVSARRVENINNMVMAVAQQYLYAPHGFRRISRIFSERGCKVKYGVNALM